MKDAGVLSLSLEVACLRRAVEAAGQVLEAARDLPGAPSGVGRALEAGTAVLGLVEARLRLVEGLLGEDVDPARGMERFNRIPASVAKDAAPDVLLSPWKASERGARE